MARLPLTGFRVLDFSWVFAGPTCNLILAALGAEVIKIESRKRPDTTRRLRPYAEGKAQPPSGGAFDALNFGKKAITLDLTQPPAAELVKRLVRLSDVVVENYSYGVMERFGLGYEALRQIRPDLVMLSFSLFGRTGPDREFFGFGGPLPVFTGLASITGYPEEGTPRTVAASWTDPLNGVSAAFAVMAALWHRQRSGQGQYIDLSMCEGGIAVLPAGVLDYTMNRRVRGLMGNRHDFHAPHGVYRCASARDGGADQWVAMAVTTEEEWQALCGALGRPDLAEDPRSADRPSRYQHQDELDAIITEWTKERTPYEAMHLLQSAGVPAGPVLNRAQLLEDPHLKARGTFAQILESSGEGTRPIPDLPWKLSGVPQPNQSKPPLLGEHNHYVFCELLGLSEDELDELVEAKIVY